VGDQDPFAEGPAHGGERGEVAARLYDEAVDRCRAAAQAHLAAFSLTSNHNGTVTLTLRPNVPLNPGAIQHALARHGIPALVKFGSYCHSNPAPANNGAVQTYPKLRAYPPGERLPTTRVVINRSALAPGTEIGFGFLHNNRLFVQNIIYDNAHTCATSPPGN
jgi:hypothetical protein